MSHPTNKEILRYGAYVAGAGSVMMHLSAAIGGTPEEQFQAFAIVAAAVYFVGLMWFLFGPAWPWFSKVIEATGGHVDDSREST